MTVFVSWNELLLPPCSFPDRWCLGEASSVVVHDRKGVRH